MTGFDSLRHQSICNGVVKSHAAGHGIFVSNTRTVDCSLLLKHRGNIFPRTFVVKSFVWWTTYPGNDRFVITRYAFVRGNIEGCAIEFKWNEIYDCSEWQEHERINETSKITTALTKYLFYWQHPYLSYSDHWFFIFVRNVSAPLFSDLTQIVGLYADFLFEELQTVRCYFSYKLRFKFFSSFSL